MHRREALRICGGIGVAGLAGCLGGQSGTESNEPSELGLHETFENGLEGWEAGASIGPEVDTEAFEWEVELSDAEATRGDRSVRIWNEGRYDDGTTWVDHPVEVESGQAYSVTVSAQFWSPGESFNHVRSAVMRLGPESPADEQDFPQAGENTTDSGQQPAGGLRERLSRTEGWEEYSFEWTTPELSTDTLHLAAGTTVVWEAEATHYLDELSVEFERRSTASG